MPADEDPLVKVINGCMLRLMGLGVIIGFVFAAIIAGIVWLIL